MSASRLQISAQAFALYFCCFSFPPDSAQPFSEVLIVLLRTRCWRLHCLPNLFRIPTSASTCRPQIQDLVTVLGHCFGVARLNPSSFAIFAFQDGIDVSKHGSRFPWVSLVSLKKLLYIVSKILSNQHPSFCSPGIPLATLNPPLNILLHRGVFVSRPDLKALLTTASILHPS